MTPAAPKPARRGEPRRRLYGAAPLEQVPVPYSPTGRAVLGALFGVLAHSAGPSLSVSAAAYPLRGRGSLLKT